MMKAIQGGDVVLSFVGQAIVAISIAKGTAYPSERPFTTNAGAAWAKKWMAC
jgi:hypothetical protein